MAINTQKFLPPPKSGALVSLRDNIEKIKKPTSTESSKKFVDNLGIIRVKVIEIDKILKGTLAFEKKKLNDLKKSESTKRREKIEEKLETKPKAETKKEKKVKIPRMGFLDWIKNFIGNIILGYFAVRLVDHLPKIIPILKFLGKATDFVLDVGGKLLDGLVTFVDWGYKAYDATKGFVKNLFGQDGVKQFEQLSNSLNQFLNLALIAGMAAAGSGGFGGGGRGGSGSGSGRPRPGKGGRPKVTTSGGRGAGRPDIRNPLRQRPTITTGSGGSTRFRLPGTALGGKGGRKLASKIGSKALKAIPFLGAGISIVEGIMRIKGGDYVGGLLSFGTAIPVAGWAFLALDVAREFMGGPEFDKSVGRAFGGKSGLSNEQVQRRTPAFSGPSIVTGSNGGGPVTRGGKRAGGTRRTVSRSKKTSIGRRIKPQEPGKVEATSPGSDVGGEEKLFGLFPNPFKRIKKSFDVANPFKVVASAGEKLGDSDYFGPILAITSKVLLGQKPTIQDYKNVGLGINLLISKGIDERKLRGGLAAYAEGGFVDPKTLEAISDGGDISDWVAKSFKDATETNAQKTLRVIRENLRLKKQDPGLDKSDPTKPVDEDYQIMGGTKGQWGPLLDLIAGKESGGNYEAMYPSTVLKGATKMTIAEVARRATGAVGKYQQLPQYLVSRAKAAGLNPEKDLYSPENQDLIITKVNIEGNRGGRRWLKGEIGDEQFMQGLSQEFASLPNAQGKFYYPGQRSSMTADKIKSALSKVKKGGYSQKELMQMSPDTSDVSKMGKGYGKGGMQIAGNLGTHMKKLGIVTGSVHRHPQHPPWSKSGHSPNSLHYQGRALDLGGWAPSHPSSGGRDEQAPVIKSILEWNKKNGYKPAQLIHHSPKYKNVGWYQADHNDHVHVAYEKGGMTKPYPHVAMIGEKGREFVIDADSTAAIESTFPGFLGAINRAKYNEAISVLRNFASYESEVPESIVISIPQDDDDNDYEMEDVSSGGSISMFGDNEFDPFATLYQGT